jgi:hypothetical protein
VDLSASQKITTNAVDQPIIVTILRYPQPIFTGTFDKGILGLLQQHHPKDSPPDGAKWEARLPLDNQSEKLPLSVEFLQQGKASLSGDWLKTKDFSQSN